MSIKFWLRASTKLLPAALLALGLAPVAAQASPRADEVPEAAAFVAVRDDYFDPTTVTVPSGTLIRWTNLGEDYHTVTSDGGAFGSGALYPGMSFSRTFVVPGTYTYHCRIHRTEGMVGTILVTGGGSVPPPSGDNLALGKPMRASSSQPGHPPAHAVDGSLETFWASSGLSAALEPAVVDQGTADATDDLVIGPESHNVQWIYVDLQGTFALRQFRMQWTLGRHARAYAVYVHRAGCGWCMLGRTSTGDGDDSLSLLSPVLARYVLLGLTYPSVPNGAYELREWQVRGGAVTTPPSESNLSLGRPAFASTEVAGHEAGRVTDGEPGTAWHSAHVPAWIYVDLGGVSVVRRAALRWADGAHASSYGLYAYVGGAWRAVFATSTGNGGDDLVFLPTVQTRYVLLYATGGPATRVGLGEFEVYGSGASSYPVAEPTEGGWQTEDSEPGPLDQLPHLDLQDETLDVPNGLGSVMPELEALPTEGFPSPDS